MLKLTKTEKRFSSKDRPSVGQDVLFSHAKQLTMTMFEKTHKSFPHLGIIDGSKCVVKENMKYTVRLEHDNLIVSPEFLIIQELTKAGEEARDMLNTFIEEQKNELDS